MRTTYQKISEDQIHPFIATYNSIGIFQQVSESCQTAQVVQELFQEQREDFIVFSRPPISPDLSRFGYFYVFIQYIQ